jgi:ABC-type uncharacterized transport system involved in gliding motility auxiliary subunit
MNPKNESKKRAVSFGVNSAFVTLTVIAIVGVINFLAAQYPKKADLTKNKLHTFSDQTEKVMKSLKSDLTATFYGDISSKERSRPVFDNYKKASGKFKFELVDPNKEPTRAKAAGIKKMDTLVLGYEGKTAKVEEITEEKITNEIIKLTREGRSTICMVSGHGEALLGDSGAQGLAAAKKGLEDQSYLFREFPLSQEAKIPSECSVVVMMGANKALFPAEVKTLNQYLSEGGRLVVGIDAVVTNADQTKEIRGLLKEWGFEIKSGLVIDPVSKMLGVDASVPIIAQFNKENTIVKDFGEQCYFPFSRPVDVVEKLPEGLKGSFIGKTTPKAWAESDLSGLAKGSAQFNSGSDLAGPLSTAASVQGKRKDTSATKETRIAVFGSSQFANNQYSRFGGNLDLFLNTVSWAVEDESMISIRAKENESGTMELSQNQGIAIFWISVVIVPLGIAVFGILMWVRRKKL